MAHKVQLKGVKKNRGKHKKKVKQGKTMAEALGESQVKGKD